MKKTTNKSTSRSRDDHGRSESAGRAGHSGSTQPRDELGRFESTSQAKSSKPRSQGKGGRSSSKARSM